MSSLIKEQADVLWQGSAEQRQSQAICESKPLGKSLIVCLALSKPILQRSAKVCWLRALLCPFAEEGVSLHEKVCCQSLRMLYSLGILPLLMT